jgi:3D (Asp-Asp-Asp) domain-containing protein
VKKLLLVLFCLFVLFIVLFTENGTNRTKNKIELHNNSISNIVEENKEQDYDQKYQEILEELNTIKEQIKELSKTVEELKKADRGNSDTNLYKKESTVSRSTSRGIIFKATAYDLSYQSCGKRKGDKGYGITANGTNLIGKTREQAMTVAVDPKIIKLGTKLRISFLEPYEHFSGIYTANDTGGAIKGYRIDIFMGDFNSEKAHQSVLDFGVRNVLVEILE